MPLSLIIGLIELLCLIVAEHRLCSFHCYPIAFFHKVLVVFRDFAAFLPTQKDLRTFAIWCIGLFTLSIRVALVQWFTDKLWRAYFVLNSCFEPLFRVLATVTGVTSELRLSSEPQDCQGIALTKVARTERNLGDSIVTLLIDIRTRLPYTHEGQPY